MHFNLTTSRIWQLFYGYYAALIRGEAIIRGRRLFQGGYQKVQRLFEAWCLLEEYGIAQISHYGKFTTLHKVISIVLQLMNQIK